MSSARTVCLSPLGPDLVDQAGPAFVLSSGGSGATGVAGGRGAHREEGD